jgi:hypothetical protein
MQRFIPGVGQRDERALEIIRRIESGTLSPSDAMDALERCQEARH